MITMPLHYNGDLRGKDICERIARYKIRYVNEHGKNPDVIYLNQAERKELCRYLREPRLFNPGMEAEILGMKIRREEEYVGKIVPIPCVGKV